MSSPEAHMLKNIGAHAVAGGAAMGYATHRLKKKLEARGDPKAKKLRVSQGVVGGAVSGAALGYNAGALKPLFNEGAVRSAKERIKSQGHKFHDIHRAVGTAGGAAVGGGLSYLSARRAQKKGNKNVDPRAAAATGAFIGGTAGHIGGSWARMSHMNKLLKKPMAQKAVDWLKNAKTKAQAKSAYRAEARKHHPDLGGDAEKMKEVTKNWQDFENSDAYKKMKESSVDEAFLYGLFDEINQIWR